MITCYGANYVLGCNVESEYLRRLCRLCRLRCRRALPPSSCDDPSTPPHVFARSAVEILKDTSTLAGSHVVFRFLSRRLRIEISSSARCSSRPSSLLGDHRAFKPAFFTWFHPIFLAQPTSYAAGTQPQNSSPRYRPARPERPWPPRPESGKKTQHPLRSRRCQ